MFIPARICNKMKSNLAQIFRILLLNILTLYFYNRLGDESGSCRMLLTFLDLTQTHTRTHARTHTHGRIPLSYRPARHRTL
jgi:hypothetical protein